MTVKFIVDLPSDHDGMIAIVSCQCFGDRARLFAVNRCSVVVMASRAVPQQRARETRAKNLWVALGKPRRRRIRRRPHDRLQFHLLAEVQRAIEQLKLVASFLGFPDTPSPLAHSNHIHARLGNVRKISLPMTPRATVPDSRRLRRGMNRRNSSYSLVTSHWLRLRLIELRQCANDRQGDRVMKRDLATIFQQARR